MKRRLFFPLLISLLIIPLVFTGCQLLGGGNESEGNSSNTTPIGRLETRVAAVEGIVGGWANNPPWITEASFAGYAKLTDIPAPPDLSGYVTKAQYDELLARVEALEGDGEDGTQTPDVVVSCELSAPAGPAVECKDDDVAVLTITLKATIKNQSNLNLKKLKFEFYPSIYCSTGKPLEFAKDTPGKILSTLTGDKIPEWLITPYGTSPYTPVFTNFVTQQWGQGFTLDAGEIDVVWLLLTLKYNFCSIIKDCLVFEKPTMVCTDYEVVE